MPKCVELMAVYDDGTVERWEAPNGYLTFVGEPGSACYQPTTTTKPLRRVTTVRASAHTEDNGVALGDADNPGWSILRAGAELFPEEVRHPAGDMEFGGPLCDFRITVEAVPVEEGKP
jgi:hypothetical protein